MKPVLVGPDPTPNSPGPLLAAVPLPTPMLPPTPLLLSPRAPFTVALGGDAFLCYVYRSLDGLVAQGSGTPAETFVAHARTLFGFLGIPVLVVVGDPIEGAPVYRPGQRAIESLPIGDPEADPGVCIGHLIRSTLEATKQTSKSTLAELDALRDQGHLISDELHTAFGERSVWAIDGTDSALVRCSGIAAALHCSFKTSDLDGTERDGAAKTAIRRARAALDSLRPIDRMIANGSVRPIDLEAARAIDPDLVERLLRHESLEERL
jgi:hypothetical protein